MVSVAMLWPQELTQGSHGAEFMPVQSCEALAQPDFAPELDGCSWIGAAPPALRLPVPWKSAPCSGSCADPVPAHWDAATVLVLPDTQSRKTGSSSPRDLMSFVASYLFGISSVRLPGAEL